MKKCLRTAKPFKTGRCSVCHDPRNIARAQLCLRCEEYAGQDRVPRKEREVLLFGELLDRLGATPARGGRDVGGLEAHDGERTALQPEGSGTVIAIPSFERLLRKAGLSRQQKQVLRMVFQKSRPFSEISRMLGISRGSALRQYQRSLGKVRSCLSNRVLVRGRVAATLRGPDRVRASASGVPRALGHPTPGPVRVFRPDKTGQLQLRAVIRPTSRAENPREDTAPIGTARHRRPCPRCGAGLSAIAPDFQYCMDCLWTSDRGS